MAFIFGKIINPIPPKELCNSFLNRILGIISPSKKLKYCWVYNKKVEKYYNKLALYKFNHYKKDKNFYRFFKLYCGILERNLTRKEYREYTILYKQYNTDSNYIMNEFREVYFRVVKSRITEKILKYY